MWSWALPFLLSWCCLPACYACRGTLRTSRGHITSPNWPRNYDNQLDCQWDIYPGYSTNISLGLTELAMEEQECYDYIEIGIVDKRFGTLANIRRICSGRGQNTWPISFLLTETSAIRVIFHSDQYTNDRGFRLVFWEDSYNLMPVSNVPEGNCSHGGVYHNNGCLCGPGFAGVSCETACGVDRYGPNCERRCSGAPQGCIFKTFCAGTPTKETLMGSFITTSVCSCAAGFEGTACGKVCSPGRYGANCTEPCGHCSGQRVCDPVTGFCPHGCATGYYPPHCQQPLSHLIGGVNVSAVTDSSFTGHISLAPHFVAGTGSVHFYELQLKEDGKLVWTSRCLGQLNASKTYHCSVDGLRPNTSYHIRALLLDAKMEGYTNVEQIPIHTEGKRQLSDGVASDITATSLRVSWTSPAPPNSEFFVMYQCETLLGCPGEPCEHFKGTLTVRSKTVVLKDLIPFASYLIVVSRDAESETIAATTLTKVPDALVSDLQTAHVTNETAVVRWRPPLVCALINGPPNNFRWELLLAMPPGTPAVATHRSGSTNKMVLMLRDLKSLTKYELRVSIINAAGGNPNQWATLLFNTTHTVPDAPRELAVYRLNATTLWTRWRVPAQPSGVIRSYVVTVRGAGAERKEVVFPITACPAWPDLVCHKVGGLKPHTEYDIVVRAVNEHGDEPGAPATVTRATEIRVPQAPKNLLLMETHPRSMAIQWQLPDFIDADLRLFEVLVTPLHDEAGGPRREEVKVTEEKPVYVHTITDLQPNTTYKIAVRCGWNGQEAHLRPTSTAAE